MESSRIPRDPAPTQEQVLAMLLEQATERLQARQELDWETWTEQYPEHIDAFRELVPWLHTLVDIAKPPGNLGREDVPHYDPATVDQLLRERTLGDYRLIREIARGGMGVVYEAEQISLRRHVALKVLPFAAVLGDTQLARFKNEAQAAASLDHPHIVAVYAVGSDRGVHFYAMRYVDGRSLAEIIGELRRQQSPKISDETGSPDANGTVMNQATTTEVTSTSDLSASSLSQLSSDRRPFHDAVARLGYQAARALHYAHEMGVVHRDVKPSNLMVDSLGHLWVTDFGLATTQTASNLTMTGDLIGTLRYMSPEQADGRRAAIDHRTDVYSLGATLYELVATRPPFEDEERGSLLRRIIHEAPPPLRQLNRRVPVDLETIIERAMAKEPFNRYATMGEMADDLQRFLDRRPILARRQSQLQRVAQWSRRNPRTATLLGVISLLLLVLGVGGPIAAVRQTRLRAQMELNLYASQIKVAQSFFDRQDFKRTIELLQPYNFPSGQTSHDLRGFEWYYLWNNSWQRYNEPIKQHWVPISSVCLSPTDRYVACGTWDGQVSLYDVRTAEKIWPQDRPLTDRKGKTNQDDVNAHNILGLAFSPDGEVLASGSADEKLILRDAHSGRLLTWVKTPTSVRNVSYAPSGDLIAVGMYVPALAVDADPRPEATVVLYSVAKFADGNETRYELVMQRSLAGFRRACTCEFSPDGTMLAVADRGYEGEGSRVTVWKTADWTQVAEFSDMGSGVVRDVTFIPGQPHLLAGVSTTYLPDIAGGNLLIWDLRTKSLERILPGIEGGLTCMAPSADGRFLVAGSEDSTIRVWDTHAFEPVETIRGHYERLLDVDVSSDGKVIVSSSQETTLRIWSGKNRSRHPTEYRVHRQGVNDVAVTRDSSLIASADLAHKLTLRQITDLHERWTVRHPNMGNIFGVDFSPDGRHLVISGGLFPDREGYGEVSVWNTETGDREFILESDEGVDYWCARYSPDGLKIAAAAANTGIRMFDVADKKLRWSDPTPKKWRRLAFARSGKFLVAVAMRGNDGALIRAYETDTGEVLWTRRSTVTQLAVAVSPDDSRIAIAEEGFVIHLLDSRSGSVLETLPGHENLIFYLDWCPTDPDRLVSSGNDSTIRLWHIPTRTELLRFPTADWGLCARFAPDGETIVAGEQARLSGVPASVQVFRSYRSETAGREFRRRD
ncbi:MAG: serine/threonine protein kinase [Planctomycetales bacterium]|nr:serine/threonine protein kinase [Planctomycetales bacterium]